CPKTAGPLAEPRVPVDPAFVDHLFLEEFTEGWISADKRLSDRGLRIVPRKPRLIRKIERRAQVKPSNAFLSHLLRFCPENAAGKIDVGKKRLENGIKGFSTDGGLKESGLEKRLDSAMASECQSCASDGVEPGGRGVFDGLPCGIPAIERGLSDPAVRMIHQRTSLGHGETFHFAVGVDHIELKL